MKNGLASSFVLVLVNKDKKSDKNGRCCLERLTTKNVIAIEVSEVSGSLFMTRFRLNIRLACPNFPSFDKFYLRERIRDNSQRFLYTFLLVLLNDKIR